jgi:hypothetical protein
VESLEFLQDEKGHIRGDEAIFACLSTLDARHVDVSGHTSSEKFRLFYAPAM